METILKYLFAGLIILAGSCSQNSGGEPETIEPIQPGQTDQPVVELIPRQPIELTRAERESLQNSTSFAFSFLAATQDMIKSDNVVISPLSLSSCLSLFACGVESQAAKELITLLGAENLSDLNALNSKMIKAIAEADNSSKFISSNLVWHSPNFKLGNDFAAYAANSYEAVILNHNADECVEVINNWLSLKTNGVIKDFQTSGSSPIILMNAMYFKGTWQNTFDEEDSEIEAFINCDRTKSEVMMMNGVMPLNYLKNEECEVVRLPYGNEAFSLYAIIPNENLKDFLSSMDIEKWNAMKLRMSFDFNLNLKMPRIELNYKNPALINVIKDLGVNKLFADRGALTPLCTPSIDPAGMELLHQAVLKIDEKGSEGAGESHMEYFSSNIGSEPTKPVSIECNRPFVFLIEEYSTGAVLFMGTVNKL